MSAQTTLTKTYQLSDRLSVAMTLIPGGLRVDWGRETPDELSEDEFEAYLKAGEEMISLFVASEGMA